MRLVKVIGILISLGSPGLEAYAGQYKCEVDCQHRVYEIKAQANRHHDDITAFRKYCREELGGSVTERGSVASCETIEYYSTIEKGTGSNSFAATTVANKQCRRHICHDGGSKYSRQCPGPVTHHYAKPTSPQCEQ